MPAATRVELGIVSHARVGKTRGTYILLLAALLVIAGHPRLYSPRMTRNPNGGPRGYPGDLPVEVRPPVRAPRITSMTGWPCLRAVPGYPRMAYRSRVAASERRRPEIFCWGFRRPQVALGLVRPRTGGLAGRRAGQRSRWRSPPPPAGRARDRRGHRPGRSSGRVPQARPDAGGRPGDQQGGREGHRSLRKRYRRLRQGTPGSAGNRAVWHTNAGRTRRSSPSARAAPVALR